MQSLICQGDIPEITDSMIAAVPVTSVVPIEASTGTVSKIPLSPRSKSSGKAKKQKKKRLATDYSDVGSSNFAPDTF